MFIRFVDGRWEVKSQQITVTLFQLIQFAGGGERKIILDNWPEYFTKSGICIISILAASQIKPFGQLLAVGTVSVSALKEIPHEKLWITSLKSFYLPL